MPNSNYQTFYPTTFPSLLDPKIGQPSGYVTKDGMWAAVPSDGRKFAIVHDGIIEHFSKNFECAMTVSYTHLTLPTIYSV